MHDMHDMHDIENNGSQHSQGIQHLRSIYFTFFGYLSHVRVSIIHLPQWTQPFQPNVIVSPSIVLTHTPSFICVLHYMLGTTYISLRSINFPLF